MNDIICAGCGSENVVEVPRIQSGKTVSIKLECGKCGRLCGYREGNVSLPKLTSTPTANASDTTPEQLPQPVESDKIDPPELWLYVSRRLDFEWLPNAPIWSAPVITFGAEGKAPTAFYRLTPQVFVWMEAAGLSMEKMTLAGSVSRSQLSEYMTLMETVQAFARAHLNSGALQDARAAAKVRPPVLPEVHRWAA